MMRIVVWVWGWRRATVAVTVTATLAVMVSETVAVMVAVSVAVTFKAQDQMLYHCPLLSVTVGVR